MKSPFLDKRFKDLTGMTFGHLFVIGYHGRDKWGNRLWLVRCDCGKEFVIGAPNLTKTKNVSCFECRSKKIGIKNTIHGATKGNKCTLEYKAYLGAKSRSTNPNDKVWKRYGGRGIKMCERWLKGFTVFISDMGQCPPDKSSLGRIDNDGDYCPENCRWENASEQANNKSNNVLITHNGLTMNMAQWNKHLGFKRGVISQRIYAGWSHEKTVTTP